MQAVKNKRGRKCYIPAPMMIAAVPLFFVEFSCPERHQLGAVFGSAVPVHVENQDRSRKLLDQFQVILVNTAISPAAFDELILDLLDRLDFVVEDIESSHQ
jgi:hypothetical protein